MNEIRKRRGLAMRRYTAVLKGQAMERLIDLPEEFRNIDLKVTVVPARRGRQRFSGLYEKPIAVSTIDIPSREVLNER
jgi:hypothetical protein